MSMILRSMAAGLTILVVWSSTMMAQTRIEKIDALISKYLDNERFNGSILVAEGGEVLLKKGYGYANFEWEIPCTPDTKFRLGSITKQFTSMLVMRQVEQGKIRLDDVMSRYLPDHPKAQAEKVTIRHLLNHTSGIPSYTDVRNPREPRDARIPWTQDSLMKVFSDLPLEFEPGTKFTYNNSGYFLLGVILEKVTGRPYERLLHEEILDPLGMKNTGYDHAAPILKKRAAGYERTGGLKNAEYLDMSIPYAAGAMYSTVEDLLIWDQALYTEKMISEKSKAEYYRPGLSNYAFGWIVRNMAAGKSPDSVWTISHGGGINGFNTVIVRVPAKRQLIAFLNNTGGAPLQEMVTGVLGILYDKPYAEPRRSVAREMERTIGKEGLEKGLAAFERMKGDKERYELREAEVNDLGYQLMHGGDLRGAVEVLRLNVREFPKSWNVYDSLGEVLAADGQIEPAIKNYEKSIELNPKNEGGRKALEELKQRQGR
jgi:CubicO group peptidase (beta-lactamase class C family)